VTNRRWQLLTLGGVVVAAVAVCLAVPGPGPRPESLGKLLKQPETPKMDQEKANQQKHMGGSQLPFELKNGKATLGDPKAKVQVTVYIPASEGCGNESAVFMYNVMKANPKKLGLTVIDFKSSAGATQQHLTGVSCSGLVIDGKQQFKVNDASGSQRMLNFHSNLGDTYRDADVYTVLDLQFRKAYGVPAKRAAVKPQSGQAPTSAAIREKAAGGTEPAAK
jgi:hypothetical protein